MCSYARCALADLALLWKVACLAFFRRNSSGGGSAVSASPMVRCDALPALYSARTAFDACETYLKLFPKNILQIPKRPMIYQNKLPQISPSSLQTEGLNQ